MRAKVPVWLRPTPKGVAENALANVLLDWLKWLWPLVAPMIPTGALLTYVVVPTTWREGLAWFLGLYIAISLGWAAVEFARYQRRREAGLPVPASGSATAPDQATMPASATKQQPRYTKEQIERMSTALGKMVDVIDNQSAPAIKISREAYRLWQVDLPFWKAIERVDQAAQLRDATANVQTAEAQLSEIVANLGILKDEISSIVANSKPITRDLVEALQTLTNHIAELSKQEAETLNRQGLLQLHYKYLREASARYDDWVSQASTQIASKAQALRTWPT